MPVINNSPGVQTSRIGSVKILTRQFEAMIEKNWNSHGGRYSLPLTKHRLPKKVFCPKCGTQIYYELQVYAHDDDEEPL